LRTIPQQPFSWANPLFHQLFQILRNKKSPLFPEG
jgi:hypothetical protein